MASHQQQTQLCATENDNNATFELKIDKLNILKYNITDKD